MSSSLSMNGEHNCAGLGASSACPPEKTSVQLVRMPSLENFLIAFTPL